MHILIQSDWFKRLINADDTISIKPHSGVSFFENLIEAFHHSKTSLRRTEAMLVMLPRKGQLPQRGKD